VKKTAPWFAALFIFFSVSVSDAVPSIVRSGTHPGWFAFSFGPAIGLRDSDYSGYTVEAPNQFKLVQTFGYHFMGQSHGPALALDIQESLGDQTTVLQVGPKFVWDIPIVRGLGVYLSPSAMLGYAFVSYERTFIVRFEEEEHGLTMQFAFEAKLVLGDRGLIFFRPITIDIITGEVRDEWMTFVRWDLLFGGGVTF
jgi:hypothetical protein